MLQAPVRDLEPGLIRTMSAIIVLTPTRSLWTAALLPKALFAGSSLTRRGGEASVRKRLTSRRIRTVRSIALSSRPPVDCILKQPVLCLGSRLRRMPSAIAASRCEGVGDAGVRQRDSGGQLATVFGSSRVPACSTSVRMGAIALT